MASLIWTGGFDAACPPVPSRPAGESLGWIGHAIEQYATGQLIRPRARYVGVVPGT